MANTIIKGQIVDQHLSGLAQGFAAGDLVADRLFPIIKTPLRKFTYIKFDTKAFYAPNSKRGYGANTVQRKYDYTTDGATLPAGYSAEFFVDRREAEEQRFIPSLSTQKQQLNLLLEDMAREKELKAAAIITNVGNYAAGQYGNVTNYASADGNGFKGWARPDTDIFGDVQNAVLKIQQAFGTRKNLVLGMTFDVFQSVIKNASIQKFSLNTVPNSAAMIDEAMLAKILRIQEVVICDGIYTNASDVTTNIYGTGFASLIYRAPSPAANGPIDPSKLPPSFGWTVQLDKYPYVDTYYDASRTSDIWQNHDCYLHLQTSTLGGFSFQSVLG